MFVILSYVMIGWSFYQVADYAAHQRIELEPKEKQNNFSKPVAVSKALVPSPHLASQRPLISQETRLEAHRTYCALESLYFRLRDDESTTDEVWLGYLPIFRRLDLEVGSILDEGGSYQSLEFLAIQHIQDEKLRAHCMVV